jgi:hypothetical protein
MTIAQLNRIATASPRYSVRHALIDSATGMRPERIVCNLFRQITRLPSIRRCFLFVQPVMVCPIGLGIIREL